MEFVYKLSIIIPHYNSPDLLANLLSTIPDNQEIQTIVIDDHSNKETKDQLQKLKSSLKGREIYFLENNTDEHNAGAARNIGLNHAKGKWLLFADSDDYFLDGFYEVVKKYFDSDSDIVFFSFKSVDFETGEQEIRQSEYCDYIESFLERKNCLTEVYLRYMWLAPWGKLIKKSMVDSNKIIFDSVPFSNDIMFSIKTGYHAKTIDASEEEIYCVTRRKGTLTTKLDLDTFEIRAEVIINYFQFLTNNLSKEELRELEVYNISWQWLHKIIRRGYGIKVFLRYLRKFRKNKMFMFDIRIFTHFRPVIWLKARRIQKQFKQRYEE